MFSKLFHKDVYLPEGIDKALDLAQSAFEEYVLSRHLDQHINENEDRSHDYFREAVLSCLESMKKNKFEAFEIEYSKGFYDFGKSGWFVTKYCVRVPYCNNQDLVVVVKPFWDKAKRAYDGKRNLIKTAWLNHRQDAHFTLRADNYCDEKGWLECQW